MKYFADTIIQPIIKTELYQEFCEIGVSYGETTDRLLENPSARITIIDPCLDMDLEAKYAGCKNVRVCKGLSLEILPTIPSSFDCIAIDGDHNWYTVFNELEIIRNKGLLKAGGTIFLHDVGWPYGRRDMYYQPETVPPKFVKPHALRGIVFGQSLLAETGGNIPFRHNALYSGGARNGVLTAIEDFLAQYPGEYWFATSWEQHGLGILFRRKTLSGDWKFLCLRGKLLYHNLTYFARLRKRRVIASAVLLVSATLICCLLARRKNNR